jgi:hypothetical protein
MGDDGAMRRHRLDLGPWPLVVAGGLAVALVAGCDQVTGMIAPPRVPAFQGQTAPAIQIGHGTTTAGPWTGWLYPTTAGACTVVVEDGRQGSPECMSGSEPFNGSIGIAVSSTEVATTASGSTSVAAADVALITKGSGEVVRITIVRPDGPVTSGHGYFMARFDAGTEIDRIVLLDASGAELESYPFGP